MSNIAVYVSLASMLCGGIIGYLLGRYHLYLLNKIRTLEQPPIEEPEPIVTMGAYEQPRPVTTADTTIGLVESKTPQRVEWEQEIATENEALGRG